MKTIKAIPSHTIQNTISFCNAFRFGFSNFLNTGLLLNKDLLTKYFIRIGLLLLIIFSNSAKSQNGNTCSSGNCPGDRIDMSKMLQYKETVPDIQLKDRFGKIFNLKNFNNEPILLTILRKDNDKLLNYNQNLETKLKRYIEKGLKLVYVIGGPPMSKSNKKKYKSIDIYFDKESLPIFSAFKINYHDASIILSKEHKTILASVTYLNSGDLEEIIADKEAEIFE